MNKSIKGICQACKKTYNMQYYLPDDNPAGSGSYYYKPCPQCHYDPGLNNAVLEAIDRNIRLNIRPECKTDRNSSTSVTTNSDELARLVIEEILKIWPKPSKL